MHFKKGLVLLFIIFMGCTSTGYMDGLYTDKNSGEFLSQLVNHLPAKDTLEAVLINEAILRQGPGGLMEICMMLASNDNDEIVKAHFAITGIAAYVSRPGLDNLRDQFTKVLHKGLKSNINKEQKAFLISQLQIAGTERSVQVLNQYLYDKYLCEPACRALVSINTSTAGENLLSNLSKVEDANRLNILQALGDLQYQPAANEIMAYANDPDIKIRLAALYGLAEMGFPPAREKFNDAMISDNPYLQKSSSSLFNLWLERTEDTNQSIAACREIIYDNRGIYTDNTKLAVLNILVKKIGEEAIEDIKTFVEKENKKSRVAALNYASKIGKASTTKRWTGLLSNSPPEVQSDIINMLGKRGDPEALSTILNFLKSEDKTVRLAAINTAVDLGGKKTIPHLLEVLSFGENSDELAAVKSTLLRFPSDTFLPKITQRMNDFPAMAKITCLEIMRERRETSYVNTVIEQFNDDSLSVRISALETLLIIGGRDDYQRVLSHMLKSEDPEEKKAAENVIVKIARMIRNEKERFGPIVSANTTASVENKEYLYNILRRLGGKESLNILLSELNNQNTEIKDAALRTLVNWPDAYAIEHLLTLAGGKEELTYKVLAIRGCLRILEEKQLGSYKETEIYNKLIRIAERDEEKKLILSGMATNRSVESLRSASGYIADSQLSDEATQVVLSLSSPSENSDINLSGNEIALALIESLTNQEVSNAAQDSIPVPEGFLPLFNGKDLAGWKGLVKDPVQRAQMSPEEMEAAQAEADKLMHEHWKVYDGILCFDGLGQSLCTVKDYTNFELLVDWKIEKDGDSGIYLRGSPQVQIWDPKSNPVGSGGLYNNEIGENDPLRNADKPIGQWNTFRIIMIGCNVTVYLNDILVVDHVKMENYWERDKPIYPTGAIELQAHHSPLYFKNIFIRELPFEELPFEGNLFNGKDLSGWEIVGGEVGSWKVDQGILYTDGKGGGWLSTIREFENFKLELEFRVPPDGNSGVFLRAPREGNPAYAGMEIQVLDDYGPKHANLKPWQYTGSIYGLQAPSQRVTKQPDQWQKMEIICDGPEVQVTLNGVKIIDSNLIDFMDKADKHPGIKRRKGYIGLQSHSSKIEYRNINLRKLD